MLGLFVGVTLVDVRSWRSVMRLGSEAGLCVFKGLFVVLCSFFVLWGFFSFWVLVVVCVHIPVIGGLPAQTGCVALVAPSPDLACRGEGCEAGFVGEQLGYVGEGEGVGWVLVGEEVADGGVLVQGLVVVGDWRWWCE